ncbi:MAG: YozE family protein [Staphylococcus epidermidis]|nr:YozE family protein [Staphylococcus epidermidis]
MVKNYSFYQFIMTVRGRKDDKGVFAEQIFEDLAFPKHEDDFNTLSEYIETHSEFTLPMSVFDDLDTTQCLRCFNVKGFKLYTF